MNGAASQFVSGRGRAQIVVILLIAGIAVNLADLILNFCLLVIFPQTSLGDLIALGEEPGAHILKGILALLQFIIFVATAVLFLMWIHRAYRNLESLGSRSQLEYSPGWAVGWFMIPLANLFMPYRVVKEIWMKSDPRLNDPSETPWAQGSSSSLLGWWWGFWLFSNFLDRIVFNLSMKAETPDLLFTLAKVELVADAVNVVAASLAIQVVKGINSRQEESGKHLQAYDMPPPPPVFTSQQI